MGEATQSNPLIELRDVRVVRGSSSSARSRAIIDDVSLSIWPGESLGIFGRSGAGKTLLARCAIGLLAPTSGSVLHLGKDIYTGRRSGVASSPIRTQMVFQDPYSALNPSFTVRQSISRSLSLRGSSSVDVEEAIRRSLEIVGLSAKLLDQRPRALSGGECQRVCLAQCLAASPDLLVLDEPVSMLDRIARSRVFAAIERVFAVSKASMLYISQEFDLMRSLCRRTIYLGQGRITEVDVSRGFQPGSERRFKDPELQRLIAAARELNELKKRPRRWHESTI